MWIGQLDEKIEVLYVSRLKGLSYVLAGKIKDHIMNSKADYNNNQDEDTSQSTSMNNNNNSSSKKWQNHYNYNNNQDEDTSLVYS